MTKKPTVKNAWRTVRCVVDYRTNDPKFSEQDLSRRVQQALDSECSARPAQFRDSKPWAKQFTASLARRESARPQVISEAIKMADDLLSHLRKL